MPPRFPKTAQSAFLVGRTLWSAADAHVGLLGLDESDFTGEERVQGDPRRPGVGAFACEPVDIVLQNIRTAARLSVTEPSARPQVTNVAERASASATYTAS